MESDKYLYRIDLEIKDSGLRNFPITEYSMSAFKVVSETPKGFWISLFPHFPAKDKWVSADARKRYAYPTIEEAFRSFKLRQIKRQKILKHQLKAVEDGLLSIDERGKELIEKVNYNIRFGLAEKELREAAGRQHELPFEIIAEGIAEKHKVNPQELFPPKLRKL